MRRRVNPGPESRPLRRSTRQAKAAEPVAEMEERECRSCSTHREALMEMETAKSTGYLHTCILRRCFLYRQMLRPCPLQKNLNDTPRSIEGFPCALSSSPAFDTKFFSSESG